MVKFKRIFVYKCSLIYISNSYCQLGNVDIMKILAYNGAEIDPKTKRLETPLHYAAIYGIQICLYTIH